MAKAAVAEIVGTRCECIQRLRTVAVDSLQLLCEKQERGSGFI